MGKNTEIKLEFTMCPNCGENVLPDPIKNDIYQCPECKELMEIEKVVIFEPEFDVTIH